MAQVMTDRQSVAANTVVANVLTGKIHEFLQRPSAVRLYGCGSAVGLNATLIVGNVTAMQDQELNAQNRMPIVPDDFVVEAGGMAGDRVVVSLRNTTGGALTGFTRIEIVPVG